MPAKDARRPLFAIIAVLVLAVAVAGAYAGRLRWQNALLRADYARGRHRHRRPLPRRLPPSAC